MPIYEYRCTKCGEKFEKICNLNQCDCAIACPKCKAPAKKLVSAFRSKTTNDMGFTQNLGGKGGCSSCGSSSCGTCGG